MKSVMARCAHLCVAAVLLSILGCDHDDAVAEQVSTATVDYDGLRFDVQLTDVTFKSGKHVYRVRVKAPKVTSLLLPQCNDCYFEGETHKDSRIWRSMEYRGYSPDRRRRDRAFKFDNTWLPEITASGGVKEEPTQEQFQAMQGLLDFVLGTLHPAK